MPRGDNPNSRKNLIVPTSEQARKNGSKGGKASVKAKQERKLLKDYIQALMEKVYTNPETGIEMTGAEIMSTKAVTEAMKGDWKAWELVRDQINQKPAEKVQLQKVEQTTITDIEDFLNA